MIVFEALIIAFVLLALAGGTGYYYHSGAGIVLGIIAVVLLLGSLTYRPVFYPMFYGYHYYARPVYVGPGYYGRPVVPVRPVAPGYRRYR